MWLGQCQCSPVELTWVPHASLSAVPALPCSASQQACLLTVCQAQSHEVCCCQGKKRTKTP